MDSLLELISFSGTSDTQQTGSDTAEMNPPLHWNFVDATKPLVNGFITDKTGVDDFVNRANEDTFLSDAEKEDLSAPRDENSVPSSSVVGQPVAEIRPSASVVGQSEKREPSVPSSDSSESASPTLRGIH